MNYHGSSKQPARNDLHDFREDRRQWERTKIGEQLAWITRPDTLKAPE